MNSLLQVYKQTKIFNIADLQNSIVNLITLVAPQPFVVF